MSMQRLASLKVGYIIWIVPIALFLGVTATNDDAIINQVQTGQADPSALDQKLLPFTTHDEYLLFARAMGILIAGTVAFCIVIGIAQHKYKKKGILEA